MGTVLEQTGPFITPSAFLIGLDVDLHNLAPARTDKRHLQRDGGPSPGCSWAPGSRAWAACVAMRPAHRPTWP